MFRPPVELLEVRRLLAFANWSAIGPAVAKVPTTAGPIASVSVVNFGSTIYTGPLNVTNTLNRIRANKGPDRADDGIVYKSPTASGLPANGTYYEFTVEPTTGTDRSFSFASPGPMRLLLATGGDCFFTGDHYSTFKAVYLAGATATPTIGAFAASPTSVAAGATVTLSATNVAETGGTIANVKFYRETNGTAGLQTAADTLAGTATASGTTYTLTTPTTGFAAGTVTYYAVATDSAAATSATSTATVTVTATPTPTPTTGELLGWDVTGQTAYGTQGLAATTVVAGLTNSLGLTRGTGVTAQNTAAADAWGGTGWSQSTGAAGVAAAATVSFGLTVAAGRTASLSAVDLTYRHSSAGPTGGLWQYQLNGGAWVTVLDSSVAFPNSTGAMPELNLSTVAALQGLPAGTAVALRLTPYAATATGGNWYVNSGTGDDLVVTGTVATAAAAPLALAGPANYLRLNADGVRVDVWNNATAAGPPARQVPLSAVTTATFAGTTSADTLVVDFANGNPLPAAGLAFDGGTGGANALSVVGTPGNDTVTVSATAVTVAAAFGSTTITYARATALTVDGGTDGDDTLLQSAQPADAATLAFANPTADDTLTVTGGTFTFPAPLAGSGIVATTLGTLAVVDAGRVVVPSAVAATDGTVLDVGEADFAGGTLDLGRNAMVVHYDDLPTVTAAVGFANGTWTGPGLTSATAAADPAHLTAVGVADAAAAGTFLGVPVAAGDVLVRTTVYGDTNLDGIVTAADYTRLDVGFVSNLTGWANGDVNYDGTVDGSDYALTDNAYNRQAVATPAAVVAKPAAVAAATPSWQSDDRHGHQRGTTTVGGNPV